MSPELASSPFFLAAVTLGALGAVLILAGIAARMRARALRFAIFYEPVYDDLLWPNTSSPPGMAPGRPAFLHAALTSPPGPDTVPAVGTVWARPPGSSALGLPPGAAEGLGFSLTRPPACFQSSYAR